MNEKQILEGNKLIAEFMGLDVLYDNRVHHISAPKNMVTIMKYHSDWNWLMPVVEKIEGLHANFENALIVDPDVHIEGKRVYISSLKAGRNFTYTLVGGNKNADSKIEATWKAIIEFINWYNNQ